MAEGHQKDRQPGGQTAPGSWQAGAVPKDLGKDRGSCGASAPAINSKAVLSHMTAACNLLLSIFFQLVQVWADFFPLMGMIRFLHENQFSHQGKSLSKLSGEADPLKEKITVNFCLSAIYYRSSSS